MATHQKSNLQVEAIEDEPKVDATEAYIQDLEAEIDKLNNIIQDLQEDLKSKPVELDVNYKIKYYQLLKTYHSTLEEFLPFG